jgi:hypothetical protein
VKLKPTKRPIWKAAEPATIGSPSSLIPARSCSSERGVGRQMKPASANSPS